MVFVGRVFGVLALHALTSTVEVSYLASFLKTHAWSRSFPPLAYGGLIVVQYQDSRHIRWAGNLYSGDMLPLRSVQDGFAGFSVIGCERGLMKTPEPAAPHFRA